MHDNPNPYDDMPQSRTQPFEFALLVLNLVDTEAFSVDDGTCIDAAALEGGFSLRYSLGLDLEFSLSHDEEFGQYSVAMAHTQQTQRHVALLALQMNHLMPEQRRFSIDPATQHLILSETWSTEDLDMTELAQGVRDLIDAMSTFASSAVHETAHNEPLTSQTALRV
jgi:hypothetical protein